MDNDVKCSSDRHGDNVGDNSEWMSNLPDDASANSLNQLAIPGSHDSFAYYLDVSGPWAPNAPQAATNLLGLFGTRGKEILACWAKTQSLTCTEQLRAGIRSFDIRVAARGETLDDLYIVHGLYGPKLLPILQEARSFLDAHPREVIILDFNHFYDFSDHQQHSNFIDHLCATFAGKLCPPSDLRNVSLNTLWQKNQQVLIFYHATVSIGESLWPGCCIPSPWPNSSSLAKVLDCIESNYQASRPADRMHVTQGIVTPDGSSILKNLNGSLSCMAEKATPAVAQWVQEKQTGKHGLNIVIVDFVELGEFISTVIKKNILDTSQYAT